MNKFFIHLFKFLAQVFLWRVATVKVGLGVIGLKWYSV